MVSVSVYILYDKTSYFNHFIKFFINCILIYVYYIYICEYTICHCHLFYRFYENPLVDTSVIGLQAYQEKKHLLSTTTTTNNNNNNNNNNVINEKDGDNNNTMNVDGDIIDDYILHFYDLSIQKPHFCYLFTKTR